MAQLPHRTGSDISVVRRDELVALTRVSLIEISVSAIEAVVDALIALLDDLSKVRFVFQKIPHRMLMH
jgi:hypothetical protein